MCSCLSVGHIHTFANYERSAPYIFGICGITFHWSTSVFLVPLAFLGALGRSGSLHEVVKLTASDGLPCKQLDMACTLRKGQQSGQSVLHRVLTQ